VNDVMLENGDIKLDETDAAVIIDGEEARIQRVLICAAAQRGRFVYDRELGSDYIGTMSARDAEMVINEALSEYDEGYVRVLECGETLRLGIETDGGIVEREVHFYGDL